MASENDGRVSRLANRNATLYPNSESKRRRVASQSASQQNAPQNAPNDPSGNEDVPNGHASNDPSQHTIASFNMSFASDLGDIMGSEKHFIYDSLKRAHALGLDHSPRSSWERAAQLIRHFWMNEKHSSAIGLQEMNTTSIVKDTVRGKENFEGGDQRLYDILTGLGLEFYSANVAGRFGSFPTLVTVWKGTKLGKIMKIGEGNDAVSYSYVADLGLDDGYRLNPVNQGRPISIVYTTRGFTLINLHGPNDPAQSHTGEMVLLRNAINKHINLFIDKYGIPIDPNKLFVMGDFNDPFHHITFSRPLVISREEKEIATLYYSTNDEPVKSCCYNFNSACPNDDDHFNNTGQPKTHANGMVAGPYECYIRKSADKALNQDLGGTTKTNASNTLYRGKPNEMHIPDMSVGERGHLANYQFTGDYVMGANVVKNLQIYRPAGFRPNVPEVSLESDHEMVFATFASPVAGGRRKRQTRHKVRRTRHKKNKQRRTRHKHKARRTRRN